VSATRKSTDDRWSKLGRSDLIALGRSVVTKALESAECTVEAPTSRSDSKFHAQTPGGRSIELFVSTQRVGGYVFWTKRRFQPGSDRYAAIVVLAGSEDPSVYLIPSTQWSNASPPFTDRENIGKRSDPEYGVSLARSSLPALERYIWDEAWGREQLR
jgi:hypothetical protein